MALKNRVGQGAAASALDEYLFCGPSSGGLRIVRTSVSELVPSQKLLSELRLRLELPNVVSGSQSLEGNG